ncbi:hypothetical protein ACVWZR_004766 [Bradyrhizobium sp. i1.3.1]
MARASATELLWDRDTEKAHLGEAFPEVLVVGRLAVEHDAHRLRRAFFGEEFARLVAELFLVVGEIEVHGGLLLFIRCHLFAPSFRGARSASPESISTSRGYGFRAWPFGPSRNDELRELRIHRSTITS